MAVRRSPASTPPGTTLPPQVTPPAFALSEDAPSALGAEVVALPVIPAGDETGLTLGPGAAELADAHDLLGVLEIHGATGKAGEVTVHPVPGTGALRKILLVGVGQQSRTDFRRAGAAVARAVRARDGEPVADVATTIPALDPDLAIEPFVVGAMLASFDFSWRSAGPPWQPARAFTLAETAEASRPALEQAVAVASAGWRSRFLVSVPSNLKNPEWLAEQARAIATEAGLECRVWDEKQLAAEGFGGIIAVGQGSVSPPRMIRLDYTPPGATKKTPTVVLVGKGITFDSGGLSIKPGEGMVNMKRDMTGGGVVMSTMSALADVGCPVRVVGLICSAENSISGSSMRPGDVVRHYGGRTSEVTNTDAEGRLVLADGLAYAVAEIEPDVIVDVATLTGGIKVALGQTVGGYFTNNDALATIIESAGETSGEVVWRMPLSSTYEDKLASKVADADNSPGGPQAIVAALFLQHFVGGLPWVHFDLAGVGDSYADVHELTGGPTGFGVRLLLAWLRQDAPLAGIA